MGRLGPWGEIHAFTAKRTRHELRDALEIIRDLFVSETRASCEKRGALISGAYSLIDS